MSDRPWGQPYEANRCCRNCGQRIRWSPSSGGAIGREPYWYHAESNTIWCDGWGDPNDTGREATP
jgi:hypothetical protein